MGQPMSQNRDMGHPCAGRTGTGPSALLVDRAACFFMGSG
jgi:hypothetical protein